MEEEKTGKNTIYIGTKPFIKYVTGVAIQFTAKNADKVILKARGKNISRAVDIAEVVRKKFLRDQEIKIAEIKIDSEEFENKEGKKRSISTIKITLQK